MGSDPIMSGSLTLFGFGGMVGDGASCGHAEGARGHSMLRGQPGAVAA